MPAHIVSREVVAENLRVSPALLVRYEQHGLIHATCAENVEGYEPSELQRVWTVLTLHRDAGINLAGVECILRLRERLDLMHIQMRQLAQEINALLDSEDEPPAEAEG